MHRTWAIIEREMRRFRRSPVLIVMSLMFPVVQLVVLGYAFGGNVRNRNVALVDQDGGLPAIPVPRPANAVAANPSDPEFSLSLGGRGFFVVGMHAGASRPARRVPGAALAFNLHSQFKALREDGRYDKLTESIRTRDMALAGSVNPMLARHGEASEAMQYSGRRVGPSWRCPFQAMSARTP